MTEVNQCTKAGQLHSSLSEQTVDSTCESKSSRPSTEFVKASQLVENKCFLPNNSSRRSHSHQPSFVAASRLVTGASCCPGSPEVSSTSSETPSSSTMNGVELEDPRREMAEVETGFCLASDLVAPPSSHPVTIANKANRQSETDTPTLDAKETSSSKAAVNVTSKRELTVAKKPAAVKKGKVEQAVVKSKKITCFFEK